MAPRKLGNPLALAVLSVVSEQPRHPYEIAMVLRARGKEQSIKINYGSLYTVVQGLEKRGLVAAAGTERAGRRPERTVYEITEAGRTALHDGLAELLGVWDKEFTHFEAALSMLPVLPPDEVVELLSQRLRMLDVQLASLRGVLDQFGKELVGLFLVEAEYETAMIRAEAGFVRELVSQIRDGTLDGVADWRAWHEAGVAPQAWIDLEEAARGIAGTEASAGTPAGKEGTATADNAT